MFRKLHVNIPPSKSILISLHACARSVWWRKCFFIESFKNKKLKKTVCCLSVAARHMATTNISFLSLALSSSLFILYCRTSHIFKVDSRHQMQTFSEWVGRMTQCSQLLSFLLCLLIIIFFLPFYSSSSSSLPLILSLVSWKMFKKELTHKNATEFWTQAHSLRSS